MDKLYIPTLHTYAMNNPFTGSCGAFRFLTKPDVVMATAKEVDFEKSSIKAECWHGPFCYEKSAIEDSAVFPMTEKGREAMIAWLESNI